VVSIAAIRQQGNENPAVFYVTTAKTVEIVAKHDAAQLFLYGGTASISLASTVAPIYAVAVPIANTIFQPATLTNKNNDIRLSLISSTVQTLSDGTIKIMFTDSEFASLTAMVFATSAFSTMTLNFAGNRSIAMTYHCLSSQLLLCSWRLM
jgi:hypothetical protein